MQKALPPRMHRKIREERQVGLTHKGQLSFAPSTG